MRRRQFAQLENAEVTAKARAAKVESPQLGVCPKCGAQLGLDARPPSEGIDEQSRRDGRKNPRGHRSRN